MQKNSAGRLATLLVGFLLLLAAGNAAAQSLSAWAVSGTQIDMSWSMNYGDNEVMRYHPSTGWIRVANNYPYSSFSDTGLSPGTTYTYYVHIQLGSDWSWDTNQVSVTTYAPPSAPSGLSATPAATQVNLSWSDTSGNETGFKIERKTGAGGT